MARTSARRIYHEAHALIASALLALTLFTGTDARAQGQCQDRAESLRQAFDIGLARSGSENRVARTVNVEERYITVVSCHVIFDMTNGDQVQGTFTSSGDNALWTSDSLRPRDYELRVMRKILTEPAGLMRPLRASPPEPPNPTLRQDTPKKDQAAPGETLESDRAWEQEDATGACTRLRNRYLDSPADVAACNRHDASHPRCVNYKRFAKIWFDMRSANDPIFKWQPTMLNELGTHDSTYVPIDHSPEHRAELQKLLLIVQTSDLSKWKSSKSFEAEAYRRCMSGNPF